MLMLCDAELTDPAHAVQLKFIEDCTADLMAISLFGREWRKLASHDDMVHVQVHSAPVDKTRDKDSAAMVALHADWETRMLNDHDACLVVFPTPPKVRVPRHGVDAPAAALRS